MAEIPGTGFHAESVESPPPRRRMSALAIVALTLVGVLVVGGGIAAGVTIYSQQQQLNRLTELTRDGASASPAAGEAGASVDTEDPGMSSVQREAVWEDINGMWCQDSECITIIDLIGPYGTFFFNNGGKDSFGCLLGASGANEDDIEANAVYCPPGSPYDWMTDPAGECGTVEDVARERLYLFQGCAEPHYRD